MTTPKIEESATLPRAESPSTAPEPLWLMRDDHTFLRLPHDVEQAVAAIKADEWKYGMLCGGDSNKDRQRIGYEHARADWDEFEPRARAWLTRALATPSPTGRPATELEAFESVASCQSTMKRIAFDYWRAGVEWAKRPTGATVPGVLTEQDKWSCSSEADTDKVLRSIGTPFAIAVAQRLAYFEAQDGLLSQAQEEAEQLGLALAETKRPLDEQMARLNRAVIEANSRASAAEAKLAAVLAPPSAHREQA